MDRAGAPAIGPRPRLHRIRKQQRSCARITTQIVTTIQQLAAFPMAGRSGRVPDTRELVISNTPFIPAYAIDHDRIVVLAIYHGARQWPEAF
jgi:toxin ParE1/3/4